MSAYAAAGEGRVMRLVVYSDYVCPFCYLAWPAIRALIEAGHAVELRAFELRPAPVPLPRTLEPRKRLAWERVIAPRAAELGLEARVPEVFPRTRKAHEAVHHARRLGIGAALHDALFRAYFVDGRDIGRIDVLVQLGESLGIERSSLKVELDIDQYTDAVLEEERAAAALGIRAVPAYVVPGATARVHEGLLGATELRAWLGNA